MGHSPLLATVTQRHVTERITSRSAVRRSLHQVAAQGQRPHGLAHQQGYVVPLEASEAPHVSLAARLLDLARGEACTWLDSSVIAANTLPSKSIWFGSVTSDPD